MKTPSLTLFLGALSSLAILPVAHADTDISVKTHMGYDTNPYRFNDQFTIEDSSYFAYELKAKHEIGKTIRVKAQLESQVYDDKATHGDNQTISAQVRYQTGQKRRPKGIEFKYKQFDKTYVSRLQGGTDTYSGVPLDDRYDYEQMGLTGFATFKVKKRVYNEIELDWLNKDYEDFDQLSITDYDYHSVKLSNTLTHKIRRGEYQDAAIIYESRMFTNREQKDLKGDEIVNTDMVFNYLTLAYDYNYERHKKVDLGLSVSYKIREDNGSGYYNSSWLTLGLDSTFELTKATKLELVYQYKDFAFDREPQLDNTGSDDEFGSDTKHEYQLKSKTRLPKWVGKRAYWDVNYTYLTAESNYSKYTYDRHTLETGLKVVF